MTNPLLRDRDVEFLLYEVFDAVSLCELPAFADHSRETFDLVLRACRDLAHEALFPAYKAMDEEEPVLEGGRVRVHRAMHALYPKIAELGIAPATRPAEVGGQSLPSTVWAMACAYLMAANLSAFGYFMLTTGAARLIESFGEAWMRERFMKRMYAGDWTGTMALTEPQAGSSLQDSATRATPLEDGSYRIAGQKIFISGGDQDLTDNTVHMVLARIDGAPPGTKGISLFAVPKKRPEDGTLADNDVTTTGLFHKIGWIGLPSVQLNFGDEGDCKGWLVGEPHRGLKHMFQMMNEARIGVGLNGIATAAVAYYEALGYAQERPQGRRLTSRDPAAPPVPIVEHADVRRMLLRQKAIVEGGLALQTLCANLSDRAEHQPEEHDRARAQALLDLMTPIAKSFPAEKGFEVNVLSIQVHGGYGYTREYLPEAWMRDQKLNSLHEGTTGIQSLDLLGRRAMKDGGRPMEVLLDEVRDTAERAEAAEVEPAWIRAARDASQTLAEVTAALGGRGAEGDVDGMLLHSFDYLEMTWTVVVGWLWLKQAAVARAALNEGARDTSFYQGKLQAAQYWVHTELPRVAHLAQLCRDAEDSYRHATPEQL